MKKYFIILAVAMLLVGCAHEPSILKGSGVDKPAPIQWQILCIERPELEICKPEEVK